MSRGVSTALLVLVVGCGKGAGSGESAPPPRMDTPKATAQAVARAFNDRNAQQAVALLPADDLIRKHFDCPGDELVKQVASAREQAPKEIAQTPKEMQVGLGEFDKQGTEEKLYKAGETYEGCKVKAPVTVHKSRLELQITKEGKTEFDGETWRFIKLGDEEKWYFLK